MDSQFCVGRCLWGSRRRSPPHSSFGNEVLWLMRGESLFAPRFPSLHPTTAESCGNVQKSGWNFVNCPYVPVFHDFINRNAYLQFLGQLGAVSCRFGESRASPFFAYSSLPHTIFISSYISLSLSPQHLLGSDSPTSSFAS